MPNLVVVVARFSISVLSNLRCVMVLETKEISFVLGLNSSCYLRSDFKVIGLRVDANYGIYKD